jgi:transposase-like protein
MKRTRRNHGAAFKAQVALAACKGDKTLAARAEQFGVHPTQITEWKRHWLERVADVFAARRTSRTRRISSSSLPRWGNWHWRMIG